MKFYFAPMEGITGYIYRQLHGTFFKGVDKYFTPFLATNQQGKFSTRELQDILPEHNKGLYVVPQILSNHAVDFLCTAHQLEAMGYEEINLNLGCPSGTVVAKKKGSGFLAYPEELEVFLDTIFSQTSMKISIKTRVGKENSEEFNGLLEIFNKYPLEELIIHPRLQKDYYKNKPNWELFQRGLTHSSRPVGYNGDIFTLQDYTVLKEAFPQLECVMLGRGLIRNPGFVGEITKGELLDKQVLKAFHDQLYEAYQEVLFGERNVLFRMKELWFYMLPLFDTFDKYGKKIKKAQHLKEYEEAVSSLFAEQELRTY